jgi:hypothetical protein
MKLKYVGAMPIVSDKGVGFDETKPDKYTFLHAAVELLEALSFGPSTQTDHLYNAPGKEYNSSELMDLLKKHCPDLDSVFATREKQVDDFKIDLIKRVNENKLLSEDGRSAWLNNIELMTDYFYQYITNETAYKCALNALGQEIHDSRIEKIIIPMFRNYGMVLNDVLKVIENRKPPIDATFSVEEKKGAFFGKMDIQHR